MPVDFERKGNIAYFTLRNGKVNPTNPEMHKQFYDALVEFLGDDNLRVGILQGAGDRAFSAGDDIKAPSREYDTPLQEVMDYMSLKHLSDREDEASWMWSREVLRLERYKPIVGAVRGYCLGQGFVNLVHLTDIRVASEDAKFGLPEIAYGMAAAGGSTRLGRVIAPALAMEMALTGDPFDAQRALSAGLVNAVVPRHEVLSKAEEIAHRIARHPLISIRIEMEALMKGLDLDRQGAIDYAKLLYRLQRLAIGGEERVESFLYKREASPTQP